MKKLLLLLALVFTTAAFAQKQVSMHMYVKVLPEHQEEFERLEIDYWSKVAKKEIDAGRMTGWGLMKSIGVDKAATEANYLIVNTFENIEQAFSGNQKWDTSFLNLTPQDISTEGIREIISMRFYQNEESINGDKTNFTIFNYGRPTDISAFVSENKSLWKGIHLANQKLTKLNSWGVHTRIHPQGNASKASIFTRDGFENLVDAMNYLSFKEANPYQKMTTKSKMNSIMPDGFGYTIIRRTLHWVN